MQKHILIFLLRDFRRFKDVKINNILESEYHYTTFAFRLMKKVCHIYQIKLSPKSQQNRSRIVTYTIGPSI